MLFPRSSPPALVEGRHELYSQSMVQQSSVTQFFVLLVFVLLVGWLGLSSGSPSQPQMPGITQSERPTPEVQLGSPTEKMPDKPEAPAAAPKGDTWK